MWLVLADDDGRGICESRYDNLEDLFDGLSPLTKENFETTVQSWLEKAQLGDVLRLIDRGVMYIICANKNMSGAHMSRYGG